MTRQSKDIKVSQDTRQPKPVIGYGIDKVELEITKRGKKHKFLTMRRYRKPIMVKDRIFIKNPEKIDFGSLKTKNTYCAGFAYKNNASHAYLLIEGEWIQLEKHDWRKLQAIVMRMGHFFGLLGQKKRKSRCKKR